MQGERHILSCMDEGRKRVLLIAAAILAARKLCQLDSTRPSPALHSIIADAVIFAERIMQRIDAEWPIPLNAYARVQSCLSQWSRRSRNRLDKRTSTGN